jgi:hypothetical protein
VLEIVINLIFIQYYGLRLATNNTIITSNVEKLQYTGFKKLFQIQT